MQAKFTICASGNKKSILDLHKRLNLYGSVQELPVTVLTPENVDVFSWTTPFHKCVSEFPENEIVDFFNADLLAVLKETRESIDDLSIILVSTHRDNEEDRPRGYLLSIELIKLLASIQASFEVDIGRQLN